MNQRNLRVAIIGAGMAGILAAIKLRAMGIENTVVYEKADRVGGTWRENTYPGLTCDVPSHHYTYTFARNPGWTRHLPPGPEVQAYFEDVAESSGAVSCVHFNHEVSDLRWGDGQWHLTFTNGNSDRADVVIAATGVLHHPRVPAINGMEEFEGAIFHSAQWDHSVALEGKRVGIVGNGSTGVQIVSALAGRASRLIHFQRTAQWIMPVENGYFSEEEREAFKDADVLAEVMDFEGYNAAVDAYTQAIIDEESEGARNIAAACLSNLEEGVRDPQLREKLRPDHLSLIHI